MDFTEYLPMEMVDEVFSYLSDKDLMNCCKVSVKWRDIANSDKLWRSICYRFSWKNPNALSNIKSSFLDQKDQFCMPQVSGRLSPVSNWRLCLHQQKYITDNWNRGHYATHKFSSDMKVLPSLSFAPIEPGEPNFVFFPLIEQVGFRYTISIMRIDGEPTKVCQSQEIKLDSAICIAGNTIAYITKNKLKVTSYQNGGFSLIRKYNLRPSVGEVSKDTLHDILLSKEPCYFVRMNSHYLIAGDKSLYLHIWDRETGSKLSFVKCPEPKSLLSAIRLHGDCLYFATNQMNSNFYKVYQYNIVEKCLTLISTEFYPVKDILRNKLYLIVVFDMYDISSCVLIYNLTRKEEVFRFTLSDWKNTGPKVLLQNNLLICLDASWVKVMFVPSCDLKKSFEVRGFVYSLYHVRQNVMIVNTFSDIQVWDWEKGVLLYTPSGNYNTTRLYLDSTRLVLMHDYGCRAEVLTFW